MRLALISIRTGPRGDCQLKFYGNCGKFQLGKYIFDASISSEILCIIVYFSSVYVCHSNFVFLPFCIVFVCFCFIVISTILYAKFTEEKIPDKTISVFWSNPWTNFKHFSGYWLICCICYCICIYVFYFGSEINQYSTWQMYFFMETKFFMTMVRTDLTF